jgi:transcriptional regulator with XRE-family HTH domain
MSVRDPKTDDHPITRLRLERGLSLRRLAGSAGLTASRIWLLENGLKPRRVERLKLATALGVEPEALLPEARHDAAR